MINPGSLTMGFAEADPRLLVPSVGTTQVGITISAVPSSANHDSRARARSNPLEELKFTTSISVAAPRSLGPQPDQAQYLGDCQIHRRRRRTRRFRRQARGLYAGVPLKESPREAETLPATQQPTATWTPTARQDSDSETQTGEY